MPRTQFHQHCLSRRRFITLCGAASAGLFITGCGDNDESADTARDTASLQSAMDHESHFAQFSVSVELEGNPNAVVWPEFILAQPSEIHELYAFHITNGGLMWYMPCYCGCKGSGHRNNRDCYIQAVHADGSVTFDSMAPT